MGNLDGYVDMTGSMSQEDINTENISNIIDELNRNSDQLDALNNVLSVVAYGSLEYVWDGTVPLGNLLQVILTAPVNSEANFSSFTYFSRASDNPPIYIATPYTEEYVNGNTDTVVSKVFVAGTNSETGQYEIFLNFYAPGNSTVFTFYYTIIAQPSNITTT